MPLTIACPTCPTKLKVPDDAGGRRVKCPKCGGVMTVPQTTPPAPLAEARPPAPPPESPSVPVARRRDDDEGDEIPEPKKKKNDDNRPSPARRPRRDDNDPPVDTDTDASPMHKGWKSVALGYRMLGVRMLIALIGVPIVVAAGIYFDVMPHLRRLADGMPLNDRDVEELSIPFAVTGVVFGLFGLFTFLAHLFLAGMPKDRQGGRGRGLGVLMLIFLFLPGFAFLNPLLLPVFSA
ncbi:MAG: zinc-ribbon domain-containing protein, partial [Fimbriiglobus sp.]|nr:zinc-ribbon domain-containing protein [Fimbriiglobus sp.]